MNTKEAVKQIKSVKPDRLVIHDRDGGAVPVVLAQLGRQRWQRLEEMLDTRAWTRVECFTTKGDLLREVQAEVAPREVAQDEAPWTDAATEVERMTAIMLKVHQGAVASQSKQIDRALDAFERMASIMSDAMVSVRDSYELAMKLQASALAGAAGQEMDGADQSMMQLVQMWMAMNGGGMRMPPKTGTPPKPGAPPSPKVAG